MAENKQRSLLGSAALDHEGAHESAHGPTYWRSLAERLGARQASAGDEFPAGAGDGPAELGRRELLQLMGASMALAGLSGCMEQPGDLMLPHVERPPELIPGLPLHYATSMVIDGFATGLVVRAREGRPIKIEGNPEHPASLGATTAIHQAAVLELYDPHRARAARFRGMPSLWRTFLAQVAAAPAIPGLWFLLHPQSSPLVVALLGEIQRRHPQARFVFDTPLDRRAVYSGARQVYGRPLEAQYDFQRAEVVLSLDADFTATMPMSLRWARDFASARRLASPGGTMNRLYAVETMYSPTGTVADHRLAVRSGEVAHLAARILMEVMSLGARPPGLPEELAPAPEPPAEGEHAAWIGAVARDLVRAAGASVVIAGDGQPAQTHAVAHLLNAALGNIGRTVTLTEPALHEPEGSSLAELSAAMDGGEVQTLIIVEANPVYTAPVDMEFARRLATVPRTAHMSLFYNETARACQWHLPAAHFLESWGDARAYDGTVSLMQPLIRPLYGSRSTTELLAAFAGQPARGGRELLQDHWRPRVGAAGFEQRWAQHVQRGLVPDTRSSPVRAAIDWQAASAMLARAAAPPARRGLELRLEGSPAVYDGRFASNGWLLELPHPLTKLTWDNAAIMSPRTAARAGVATEDVIELRAGARALRAPVLVLPGHADEAVTLTLGYGRQGEEALARGVGVNAYLLRTAADPLFTDNARVSRTGDTYPLAITQEHWTLDGREIVFLKTLAEYQANPDFAEVHREPLPSLLPARRWEGDQWGMTIDTMICTGCSACVVACQAENNIPIVGKSEVKRSREMHWLRVDRYFVGEASAPAVINQPMMCQHCEKAPCEYVCPVNATVHSPDGLNEMVYNRCIGTRFCSNNCPYKVRRFNWFRYTHGGALALQRNPEVSVRERGVMEKCTYCVQRIRAAQIQARLEDRPLASGDVLTACQQACPTRAIQFDSLKNTDSAMVRWREDRRAYAVLHRQGARPRTWYLVDIHNPNPEMK